MNQAIPKTGFYDTHVYYWPAARFAAKLRAMKTGLNLLLLRTNRKGGHGSAEFSGRLEGFRKKAFEYAFLLDLVGIQRYKIDGAKLIISRHSYQENIRTEE